MNADFSENTYYGYLVKGSLPEAIHYVKQFPEQAKRYQRFLEIFEKEQYMTYEADAWIHGILLIYQKYYRDVFYLCMDREDAAARLQARLAVFLGIHDAGLKLCDLEQNQLAEAFQRKGFHFLGGRTSGYYGPYIWQTTENRTYEVELPEGTQPYTVRLLDGFLSRSWLDYLSFGEIGTGGWTDDEGIINCVKSSYDFHSEAFTVSLLKHEAQHARDLAVCKEMPSEELEYRAKLVELIYSVERDLLAQFAREADHSDKNNGHAAAACRILDGFARKLHLSPDELEKLPRGKVQAVANMLFTESALSFRI